MAEERRGGSVALFGALAMLGVAALWLVSRDGGEALDRGSGPDSRAKARAGGGASLPVTAPGDRVPRSPETKTETETVVAGVVLDGDGAPARSGEVELVCTSRPGRASRRTLDAEGRFEGEPCPGLTCVRLRHPGLDQPEPWELESGEVQGLRARWSPRSSGRVVAPEGGAVAGALLRLRARGQVVGARTDVDGSFSASFPSSRPCDRCDELEGEGKVAAGCRRSPGSSRGEEGLTVLIQAPGYAATQRSFEGLSSRADEELELRLDPLGLALHGSLLDSQGASLGERARILAQSLERPLEAHSVLVDSDGSFTMEELGLGGYALRAVRDGIELAQGEASRGDRVVFESDRSACVPELQLHLEDPAGLPCAGVRIDGGPFHGARTDEGGLASALDVIPATYTLRMDGARRELLVDAGQGAPVEASLTLDCHH